MALEMNNGGKAEEVWRWVCRICAVVGFVYLVATRGLGDAPWGLYLLLLGLFFGPEVIRGQFQINRHDPRDETDDSSHHD